jgi:hypothetical protein
MSKGERIVAFYSRGPHFLKLLKYLRDNHPNAHITALVPKGYPVKMLQGRADNIEQTAEQQYSLSQGAALFELRRQIRRGNFTHFVTMFNTPKLQALARICGIPNRNCFGVDGRFTPLRSAPLSLIFQALVSNIRGRQQYARIHRIVHQHPVPSDNDER